MKFKKEETNQEEKLESIIPRTHENAIEFAPPESEKPKPINRFERIGDLLIYQDIINGALAPTAVNIKNIDSINPFGGARKEDETSIVTTAGKVVQIPLPFNEVLEKIK